MPRLDMFHLAIKTGERRGPETAEYAINGFPLDFDECEGSTESGGMLHVKGNPQSFPHALVLQGPKEGEGTWDIESVEASYTCAGEEPYTIHLGAISLDDESDLNIWYERPAPTFDV